MPQQMDVPWWKMHGGGGYWQDLQHTEKSPHCSRFSSKTQDPVEDPHWSSQFLKNSSPWEGTTLEQFMKDCLLWERAYTGVGSACEEEEAAETKCYELILIVHSVSPFPIPSCFSRGRKIEWKIWEQTSESRLGKRTSWSESQRWSEGWGTSAIVLVLLQRAKPSHSGPCLAVPQ